MVQIFFQIKFRLSFTANKFGRACENDTDVTPASV